MAPKKCKTENGQKRKNFMAANTITAPGSMIHLSPLHARARWWKFIKKKK